MTVEIRSQMTFNILQTVYFERSWFVVTTLFLSPRNKNALRSYTLFLR